MNRIESILLEKISDFNTAFVFPTQIACDLWAEKIISDGSVKAVSMDRFIPWDVFKENAIKSTQKEKKSVPSIMRRFFASDLLKKNAEKPFLQEIVSPEYAQTSSGFVDWITNLLPGLSMWKTFFDNSGLEADGEDKDFYEIYQRYKAFLDKYNLFDPAWESPPFSGDGRNFIIFFPEILSDWFEYEALLKSSPEIQIVTVDEKSVLGNEEKTSPVFTFTDSRTEINSVARFIRSCHEEKGIPWDKIALSVPDMDSYGSYVERELSLFQIPFVSKFARPLSSYGAGNLFTQLRDAYSSSFTFESVKNLLLNTELPWNDREARDQLIEFGRENNCILCFEEDGKKIDVWEKSFALRGQEQRAFAFYRQLKASVSKLVSSKTFDEIRKNWFSFRDEFFDMENCAQKADRIISRSISELSKLIELEKEFEECKVPSPFSFFISILDNKPYLAKSEERGVHLLPYMAGATSPFALQIVLDSNQKSLSVVYRLLSFLREDKRKLLLQDEDVNAGDKFLALYMENSLSQKAWFSSAFKTFSGYSQPVSSLSELPFEKALVEGKTSVEKDFYKAEKLWYEENGDFPSKVTSLSKRSAEAWIRSGRPAKRAENAGNFCEGESDSAFTKNFTDSAKSIIESKIIERTQRNGKPKVSYSQLKNFLKCKRFSLLQSVLQIREEKNEAELIDKFEVGNLNHAVFEYYLKALKERRLPVHTEEVSLSEDYVEILRGAVTVSLEERKKNLSYTASVLLDSLLPQIFEKMKGVVHVFSKKFEGYTVYAVEDWFSVEMEDFVAEGKIDAILSSPTDGGAVIIDFKTSSSGVPDRKNMYLTREVNEEGETIENIPDFQMPMYLWLLKKQRNPVQTDAASYFKINDSKFQYVFGETDAFPQGNSTVSLEDYEPTVNKFEECMALYVEALKNFDYSINEETLNWEDCAKCTYRAMCRKTFTVGRGE